MEKRKLIATKPKNPAATADTMAIPLGKFYLLSVVTFGLYQIYWAWKAWETVGKAESKPYRTAVRGFFLPVTAFALFPKVLGLAKKEGYKKSYPPTVLAAWYLALNIFGYVPTSRWINEDLDAILSLVWFFINMSLLLPVVAAGNFYVAKIGKEAKTLRRNIPFILTLTLLTACITLVAYYFLFYPS